MKKQYNLTLLFFLLASALFAQVGIGNTNPDASSILDITATDKGVLVPRVALASVTTTQLDGINNAATGLLIWNTNATTTGGLGIGFYYFDGVEWTPLTGATSTITTENGLSNTGNTARLGGTLNQDTAITTGNYDIGIILSGTGDFSISDGANRQFEIAPDGTSTFWGDSEWRNEGGAGEITARMVDFGNEGIFDTYRAGAVQNRIDSSPGFATIFNEQGIDLDFRVESENNPQAFGIIAGEDVMFAGTNIVSLTNNGATVNGVTVDYVASLYTSNLTNGTAVQIGSTEYLTDFGNLIWGPYGSWAPYSDNTFDLGTSTFRWDDVYATSGVVNTSDIRLKKNIETLQYGLAEILQLNPISYQWKNTRNPAEVKIGFSAQQLLEILPEVVKTHEFVYPDENSAPVLQKSENLGVYYSDIIPVLTKAIQEQQQFIIKLQNRVSLLENKL